MSCPLLCHLLGRFSGARPTSSISSRGAALRPDYTSMEFLLVEALAAKVSDARCAKLTAAAGFKFS